MTQPSEVSERCLKRTHCEMETTDDPDNSKESRSESVPSKKPKHDENAISSDAQHSNATNRNSTQVQTERQETNGIQTLNSNSNQIHNSNVLSLFDDESMEGTLSLFTHIQREELLKSGYCMLQDPMSNSEIMLAVQGYIRQNVADKYMIPELIRSISSFYPSRYDIDLYIELQCCDSDDTENKDRNETFLIPRRNIALSGVLNARMDSKENIIMIDERKVNTETMHRVLAYLGHHRGVKPEDIAKPIRSVNMERIVADTWDAEYVNSLAQKTLFKVILAASYLECLSLLHLGAAKVATLIKGKSVEEIKIIMADGNKILNDY